MEKNKRDFVILITLLTILINYSIFTLIVSSKLNKLKELKNKYNQLQENINTAINLKTNEKNILKEIEKLEKDTVEISQLTPNAIDTPQLIYDFYNYCIKYNAVGDTIQFQLEDNNQQAQLGQIEDLSGNLNQTEQNNQQSTNENSSNFKTLDISLDVYCSRDNIDEFLSNLNAITKRKLNIKSITISQPTEINTVQIEGNTVDEHTQRIQGKLPVKIVFVHYLYFDGNEYKNDYNFFDLKLGFDRIADMFKE